MREDSDYLRMDELCLQQSQSRGKKTLKMQDITSLTWILHFRFGSAGPKTRNVAIFGLESDLELT